MNIRAAALSHLRARLATEGDLRKRLGIQPDGLTSRPTSSRVLASKVYPPEHSWTGRWSWWHQFSPDKLEGEGDLVLLCEARSGQDFHSLAVPRRWLREHQAELSFSDAQGKYNLFLSAVEDDLFAERRGQGLDFSHWQV